MKFYSILVMAVIFASAVKPHPITPSPPAAMSEELLAKIKSNVLDQCVTILRQSEVVIIRLYISGRGTRAQRSALQEKAGQVRQLISLLEMATEEAEIKAISVQLIRESCSLKVLKGQFVGNIKNMYRFFF